MAERMCEQVLGFAVIILMAVQLLIGTYRPSKTNGQAPQPPDTDAALPAAHR